MSATDHFSQDATGLPESRPTEIVDVRAGRGVRAAHRAGRQAHRRRGRADAGLQRVDPRPDAAGRAGLGDRRRRRQRGRPRGDGALARAAAGQPLRRHARDAGADPDRRALHVHASRSRTPASTGTTRTSARTTARRWASTATSSSCPPTRTTGRPSNREIALTLDDVLIEDGQIAPFSRSETDLRGDGPLRQRAARRRRARARARRAQRGRGRAPVPDQHRQHARVQGRAARRADEARRRRQRPLSSARSSSRRSCSRRRSASSSTCCFEQPGELTLEHRTPGPDLPARRDRGRATSRPTPSLAEAFETLRTRPELAAERERLDAAARAPSRTRRWRSSPRWTWASPTRRRRCLRLPDASRGRSARSRAAARVRHEAHRQAAPTATCARCTRR